MNRKLYLWITYYQVRIKLWEKILGKRSCFFFPRLLLQMFIRSALINLTAQDYKNNPLSLSFYVQEKFYLDFLSALYNKCPKELRYQMYFS